MKYIYILTCVLLQAALVVAAEHTVTWGYTPPMEPAVVGFRLWRGAGPYTLVAEFPGWARGSLWTQETPIASGEVFTLTAVFADATESPRSSVYVYPMGDGTAGIRHARFRAVVGVTAAPLTKQHGARLR
jgi:hypothetical protein